MQKLLGPNPEGSDLPESGRCRFAYGKWAFPRR